MRFFKATCPRCGETLHAGHCCTRPIKDDTGRVVLEPGEFVIRSSVVREIAATSEPRVNRGVQTRRLGHLQVWLHEHDFVRLGNALSDVRWLIWRLTGGSR